MNNNEIIKNCREVAKSVGLTFKVNSNVRINGVNSYMFTCRKTGEAVLENCTLLSAYSNCLTGYIESWDGEKFQGVNVYK